MSTLGTRRTMAVLVLAALGTTGLMGCSSLPSAPSASHERPSVEASLLRMPSNAGLGGAIGGVIGGAGGIVGGATTTLTRTVKSISGNSGGEVKAGRFSVDVPPGAFEGTGEITIDVADSTILRVDLHIQNVPNEFHVPVTLTVSFAGFEGDPDADPRYFKIFWNDEAAGVWRMLPTTVDLEAGTVSTQLEHFSTYGVLEAKAGW